jgi:hypothetical protein
MRQRFSTSWIALTLTLWLGVGSVLAHITPPVVLLSEQDAVRGMTGGATKFFVREVRLTAEERGTIRQQWGWPAEDELYRGYRCYSSKTLCKTMLGGIAAGILPWVSVLPRHTSTTCPTSTGRSSPASYSGPRFSLKLRS